MKSACKNGTCDVIHNENTQCDYRQIGRLCVCNYMHQGDGRCLHKIASAPPKRRTANTSNDVFYRKSCESFAAHYHEKQNKEYLPYR